MDEIATLVEKLIIDQGYKLKDITNWSIICLANSRIHLSVSFKNKDFAIYSVRHLGSSKHEWQYVTEKERKDREFESYG